MPGRRSGRSAETAEFAAPLAVGGEPGTVVEAGVPRPSAAVASSKPTSMLPPLALTEPAMVALVVPRPDTAPVVAIGGRTVVKSPTPTAEMDEMRNAYGVEIDGTLHVTELTHVVVVAGIAAPAEEDVTGRLHEPLSDHDALTLMGEL